METEKIEVTASQAIQIPAYLELFGMQFHIMGVTILLLFAFVMFIFWRIQIQRKLDFADMITKDGRTVSLTKMLQLIGGVTATWIMVKLTLAGDLTDTILGIYLAYVGCIEGYSKYVAAKYQYTEHSVQDFKKSIDAKKDK